MESKDLNEAVAERDVVVKAFSIGASPANSVAASNVVQGIDEAERNFSLAGAIEPPYNPTTLAGLFEHSSALRQNVEAYATNVHGFGHRYEPVIDLDSAEADQRIAQAMYVEREQAMGDSAQPASVVSKPLMPTDLEVAERKKDMVSWMRAEKTRLDLFFKACVSEMSFVELRGRICQDLEVTGNSYLEILRNGANEPAEFVYVPSFTVRLLALGRELVDVQEKIRISDTSYSTVTRRRRFRMFVQIFESVQVYFKEFGDPRVISSRSGRVFVSIDDLKQHDASDTPATEILHFKIHSPRSAYGVPRWIGALISVLGSRQAEEVNYLYFDNKSVPPLALLVSGGRVSKETVTRLEDYIEHEIKGKKNFHRILVIEGTGTGGGETLTSSNTGTMKLELKPLTDAQNKDALFQAYDERNMDKVGMAFRLPRMIRGDIRDFNRATADAALEFAEQQVFSPEREKFDFIMNRKILPELSIRFWGFESNAPSTKNPKELSEIIKELILCNVLTPEEGRQLAEGVFNKEFARIDAAWVKQPVPLTLAGISPLDPTSTPWTGEEPGIGQERAAYDDEDADGRSDVALAAQPPRVTATSLGHVITVNEARKAYGYGPLMRADGSPDPMGGETIEAFRRAKEAATGATSLEAAPAAKDGFASGGGALDGGMTSAESGGGGTLSLADLQTGGGLLGLAQGSRLRRLPPRRKPADMKQEAKRLIALRDALLVKEREAALQEFIVAKREELAAQVPVERIREAFVLDGLLGPLDVAQ